jgi:hypothetical protein
LSLGGTLPTLLLSPLMASWLGTPDGKHTNTWWQTQKNKKIKNC